MAKNVWDSIDDILDLKLVCGIFIAPELGADL